MAYCSPPRLCVLMIAPDPLVPGGVSFVAACFTKYLKNCDVTFFTVGKQNSKESIFALLFRFLGMVLRFIRVIQGATFDVIHINPSFNYKSLARDGMLIVLLHLMGKHQLLIYFHGWDTKTAHKISKCRFQRRLLVWLLKKCRYITVLSPDFKDFLVLMGIDKEKIKVTTTLFDGDSIPSPCPAPTNIILFMSRLEKQKGIYCLLLAFAAILLEFPSAKMVFAGNGSEKERLYLKAKELGIIESVLFTGYVTGSRKTALLRECAIFALPTLYPEGLPVALLEGMASGKPLLTSKAGGIGHIIKDPENGIVLDEVTVETIAAGLKYLLAHPDYCLQTGSHNVLYAFEHFEARKVTAQLEKLYHVLSAR